MHVTSPKALSKYSHRDQNFDCADFGAAAARDTLPDFIISTVDTQKFTCQKGRVFITSSSPRHIDILNGYHVVTILGHNIGVNNNCQHGMQRTLTTECLKPCSGPEVYSREACFA
ncbi:TPA: hypothetical protein ACH3X2_007183 [Trebouxia sp. C0005]